MPKIPEYRSKLGLPTEMQPRVPGTSPVGDALTRGGAEIANAGLGWVKEIAEAETASATAKAIGEANRRLFDSRLAFQSSTEFNTDPVNSVKKWETEARQIKAQILEGMKDNRAKTLFSNQFETAFSHHYGNLASLAETQRVRISAGDYQSALDNLTYTMSRGNVNDFAKGVQGIDIIGAGAKAGGTVRPDAWQRIRDTKIEQAAMNNLRNLSVTDPQAALDMISSNNGPAAYIKDIQPIKTHAEAQLSKQHQTQVRASEDYAYKYTFGKFMLDSPDSTPQDFFKAYQFVMDPANSGTLGLPDDLSVRTRVAKTINADGVRVQQQRVQQQDQIDAEWTNKALAGQTTANEIIDSPMSPEKKENAINWMNKSNNMTDRATWNAVYAGVLDGSINNPSDLLKYQLSTADTKSFGAMISTMSDNKRSIWFTEAMKNYDKRYDGEFTSLSEATEHRIAFSLGLNERIQREKLTGPQILEAAGKMFKEQDDAIGRVRTNSAAQKQPGLIDRAKSAVGIGNQDTGAPFKAQPIMRPLPSPPNKSGQPEIVGTYMDTGIPAYRMPDGSLSVDWTQQPVMPQLIGIRRSDGKPVYQMQDGSYGAMDEEIAE